MSGHEWLAQTAPYALGALDPAERAAFEAHLAGCARCQAEVRTLREVASRLAESVTPLDPPARLRDRVLAEARRVRPIATARGRSRAAWLTAAAALLVALGAAFGWWTERRAHLAALEAARAARALVAQRDSVLQAVLAPDVATTALAATGQPPAARLFYDKSRHRLVMTVFNLPAAPAGRTYQLWGIPDGSRPVSLGTFNTGADGRLTATMNVADDLAFTTAAVTEEPAGGSDQPTQTPFLVGRWSAAEREATPW